MRSVLSSEKYTAIRELHILDYIARKGSIATVDDYLCLLENFFSKQKYPFICSNSKYEISVDATTKVKILKPDNELLGVCKVADFSRVVGDILSENKIGAEKSLKSLLKTSLEVIKNGEEIVILLPLNYDLNKWLTGQVIVTKTDEGAIRLQSDVFATADNFFSQEVLSVINSIVEQCPEATISYGEVNSISKDENDFFSSIAFLQNTISALKSSEKAVALKARDQLDLLAGTRARQGFGYEKVLLNGEVDPHNPFFLLLPLISHVEKKYEVFQKLLSFLKQADPDTLFKELEAAFGFIKTYQKADYLQESKIKQWSLESFAYKRLASLDSGQHLQVVGDGFDIFINFVEQVLNVTGRQEEARAFKGKCAQVEKRWYLRAESWSLQSQLAVIENVKSANTTAELDQTLNHQQGYFDVAAILDSVDIMQKVLSFDPSGHIYPINHAIINDSVKVFKAFLVAEPSLISQTNAKGNIMHLVMGSVFINGSSRFEILNYLILNHPGAVKDMLKARDQHGLRPLDVMPGFNSLYALKIITNRVSLGVDLNNPEDFQIFADIKVPTSLDEREKLICLYNHYFQYTPALTGEFNLSEAIDSAKLAHIWNWLNSSSFDPDLQELADPSLTLALFKKGLKEQTAEWLQLFIDHGVGLNYEENPSYDLVSKKPQSALHSALSKGLLFETKILVNAGVVFKTEHLSWIPDGHPDMSKFVKLQADQKVKPGYELLHTILDRGDKPLEEVLTNEYISKLYEGRDREDALNALKKALFISKGSGKKRKKVLKEDLTALQVLQIIPATSPESLSRYNPSIDLRLERLFYCARNGYIKELFYILQNYPDMVRDIRRGSNGEFLIEHTINHYVSTNRNAIKVIDLLIAFEFSLETSISKLSLSHKKSEKQKILSDSDTAAIMKLAAEKGLKDVIDILHLRGVCFTEAAYDLVPEELKANFTDHKTRLDKEKLEVEARAEELARQLIEIEDATVSRTTHKSGKKKSGKKKPGLKTEKPISQDTEADVNAKQTGSNDVEATEPEITKDKVSSLDMDAIERALNEVEERQAEDQGEWFSAKTSKNKKLAKPSSERQQRSKNDGGKPRNLTNLDDVQQPGQTLKDDRSRQARAAIDVQFKNAAAAEEPSKVVEADPTLLLPQEALVEASQKQTGDKPKLRQQQKAAKDETVIKELQNQKMFQLEAYIFGKFDNVVFDQDKNTISLFSNNAVLKTVFVTGFSDYKFNFCDFIEENKLHANVREFRAAIMSFVENHDNPIEEFEKSFKGLYEMSERMAVHLKHSQKRDLGPGI